MAGDVWLANCSTKSVTIILPIWCYFTWQCSNKIWSCELWNILGSVVVEAKFTFVFLFFIFFLTFLDFLFLFRLWDPKRALLHRLGGFFWAKFPSRNKINKLVLSIFTHHILTKLNLTSCCTLIGQFACRSLLRQWTKLKGPVGNCYWKEVSDLTEFFHYELF